KMWSQYGGSSQETKNARSVTPEGFAYAFFMANNYLDLSPERRLTGDYPEVSGAVTAALKAGLTEQEIRDAAEGDENVGYRYGNEDYDAAREAIVKAVADKKRSEKAAAAPADVTPPQDELARMARAGTRWDKLS